MMPRLEALMFCEGLQPLPNGKVGAMAIITNVEVRNLPTAYTISAIAEISGLPKEVDFISTIRLFDPNRSVVFEQSSSGRFANDFPGLLGMDFRNFWVEVEGDYTVEVLVNGEKIGQRSIPVSITPKQK